MLPKLWYSRLPGETDRSLWGFPNEEETNGRQFFKARIPANPYIAASVMHWFDEAIEAAGGSDGPQSADERQIGDDALSFIDSTFGKLFDFYKFWIDHRSVSVGPQNGFLLVNHHPWETLLPFSLVWDHLYEEVNISSVCSDSKNVNEPLFAKENAGYRKGKRLSLDSCLARIYAEVEDSKTSTLRSSNFSVSLALVTTNIEAYLGLKQLERMASISGSRSGTVRQWWQRLEKGIKNVLLSKERRFGFDATILFNGATPSAESREEYFSTNAAVVAIEQSDSVSRRFESGLPQWKTEVMSTLFSEWFLPGPSFTAFNRLSKDFNASSPHKGAVWLRSNNLLLRSFEKAEMNGVTSMLRFHSQNLICQDSQPGGIDGPLYEAYDSISGVSFEETETMKVYGLSLFLFRSLPQRALPDTGTVDLVGIGVAVTVNVLVVLGMASGCVVIGLKVLRNMSQRSDGRSGIRFSVPTLQTDFNDEYTQSPGKDIPPGEGTVGDADDQQFPESKVADNVSPEESDEDEQHTTEERNQTKSYFTYIPVVGNWFNR